MQIRIIVYGIRENILKAAFYPKDRTLNIEKNTFRFVTKVNMKKNIWEDIEQRDSKIFKWRTPFQTYNLC